MALAVVGETLDVKFDLVFLVDGVENTIPTAGKTATVRNRLDSGIDPVTGEQVYQYFLEFSENFDIVDSNDEVIQTLNTFWFSEKFLQQGNEDSTFAPLSRTTSEINSALSSNKRTISINQKTARGILNSIPAGDLFRDPVADITSIIERNKAAVDSVKFKPNDPTSINNITTDLEGSNLLAEDTTTLVEFTKILKTQQEVVAGKTEELGREETQSFTNSNKSEAKTAAAVNTFITKIPNLRGADTLILTSENFTPVDWDTVEPKVPLATSVLPETLTPTQEAGQLFPLLDSGKVVQSGIV